MNGRILTVVALLLVVGAYMHLVKPVPVLLEQPLAKMPVVVGDWYMINDEEFSESVMNILRPTDYLSRDYRNSAGQVVTLYIGYHGGRDGDGGIHSPRNCLPSSGWHQDYFGMANVDMKDGQPLELVNAVMSKGPTKVQFYYWFQVRDWIVTDEYRLKLAGIWNSVSARRKDQTFVRLSTSAGVQEAGQNSQVLATFVKDFFPVIQEFLPS